MHQGVIMDEALEEEKKLRRLRFIVDFALKFIATQDIPHEEALKIVEGVRRQALKMFPGKDEAFEIIYIPRFRRALNNKYHRA